MNGSRRGPQICGARERGHMEPRSSRAERKAKSASEVQTVAEPLDLAHLRQFTLGDKHLESEILGLFIAQVPVSIATLKQAENDGAWYLAAHSLKGSARAVGARRLAALAARAERLGGVSDMNTCRKLVRMLEDAAEEAQVFIRSLMPKAQRTT